MEKLSEGQKGAILRINKFFLENNIGNSDNVTDTHTVKYTQFIVLDGNKGKSVKDIENDYKTVLSLTKKGGRSRKSRKTMRSCKSSKRGRKNRNSRRKRTMRYYFF